MFAIETPEPDEWLHVLIAGLFSVVAIIGARWSLWIVVLGFLAHGIFDTVLHYTSLHTPNPDWYGPFCLGFDVALALGLAGFLAQGDKLSDMS